MTKTNHADFRTVEVTAGGTTYHLRELSVGEIDEIEDASKQPDGSINYRLNSRMSLSYSIETPAVTPDDIVKWPTTRYGTLMRAFNKLNTVEDPNDSGQSGSSEPTSPTSGESSPAT